MTKIIFDSAGVTKKASEVIDFSKEVSEKVIPRTKMTAKPDVYSSNTKILNPFYNKFLPKRFRRYKEVEFYPGTKMKKHVDTYNSDGDVIKSKSYDEVGTLTFKEIINPKTNHTKTMIRSDGEVIEQEMLGSVLLKKSVRDYEGYIKYNYEFDSLTSVERTTEVREGVTTFIKKRNNEEVLRHIKTPDGEIRETLNDTRRGIKYYYEAGIIHYQDGHKSATPKFKRLTIKENNSETSSVYEFVPDENIYSYKVYNADNGAQIGETKYLHSEQMRNILERILTFRA